MSEPITAGDLVMVVRGIPCCGFSLYSGRVFTVSEIYESGRISCGSCGDRTNQIMAKYAGGIGGYALSQLKKLPPLSELKDVKTDEPIKEPA